MDLKRIYQMLSKLDADEEIGYAYYRQTGKNLDFFDMNRIKLHAPSGAKDFDFSYLESEEAVHSRAEMEAYINRTGADLLHEQNHIAKNCNVELNYVPQYLDIPPISTIFLKLFTLCVANAGTGSKHRQLKCKPVILLSFRPTSNILFFPCQRAARLTSKSVKAPSTACLSISCKIKRSCPTTLPKHFTPKIIKTP